MSDSQSFAAALVAALSELTNVAKGHTANAGKKVYTFTNIADLVAETRPVLAKHGLVALTSVHGYENRLACTVELVHTSGETKRFDPLPFPEGNDAQTTGSWMTYMRRYALLSALGMGTEDDDGASAKAAPRTIERANESRSQTPPPGKPVGQVKAQLVSYLEGKVPVGTEKDHAAQVWSDAEVKVLDGKWVTPDEVTVVMETAKEHAADLAAVNA